MFKIVFVILVIKKTLRAYLLACWTNELPCIGQGISDGLLGLWVYGLIDLWTYRGLVGN